MNWSCFDLTDILKSTFKFYLSPSPLISVDHLLFYNPCFVNLKQDIWLLFFTVHYPNHYYCFKKIVYPSFWGGNYQGVPLLALQNKIKEEDVFKLFNGRKYKRDNTNSHAYVTDDVNTINYLKENYTCKDMNFKQNLSGNFNSNLAAAIIKIHQKKISIINCHIIENYEEQFIHRPVIIDKDRLTYFVNNIQYQSKINIINDYIKLTDKIIQENITCIEKIEYFDDLSDFFNLFIDGNIWKFVNISYNCNSIELNKDEQLNIAHFKINFNRKILGIASFRDRLFKALDNSNIHSSFLKLLTSFIDKKNSIGLFANFEAILSIFYTYQKDVPEKIKRISPAIYFDSTQEFNYAKVTDIKIVLDILHILVDEGNSHIVLWKLPIKNLDNLLDNISSFSDFRFSNITSHNVCEQSENNVEEQQYNTVYNFLIFDNYINKIT